MVKNGRRSARSLVDVVEAIYEEPRASWLPAVLAGLHGLIPESPSGVAYVYDLSGPPEAWRTSYPVVTDGAPAALAEEVYQSFAHAPADFRRTLFGRMKPAATYSETMGTLLTEQHEHGAEAAKRVASYDAVYVNAVDPDGRGVLLAFNLAARHRLVPKQRARFAMIAAHVAAARRLVASGAEEPGAIFAPSGKVAHVERGHESALESLRERVIRLERARSSRADPDELLTSWRALVAGTYTLVGRVESDGRRYVIAYENPPGVRDPRGLAPMEAAVAGWTIRGHSQKLIGYELGVSVGTVGGLLARVYQKLRVRSRVGLIERLAPPEHLTRMQANEQELLVFSGPRPNVSLDDLASLTPAEQRVVRALLRGKSSDEIAASLGKSKHTVTHQLGRIFRRLSVSSRAELIARWAKTELVDVS
ncbi:MAG: hypothetical protein KIT84_30705 [Labilithrix sp.]|nr:hypothetical protein [Labilithrix sp.]MCW5815438.1 hypothetical protein [Labilithrix sp.]